MSASRAVATSSRRAANQSISSTTSNGSNRSERGERSERTRTGTPAVESAVTRLLVSIKQLLESLTRWSHKEVDDTYISDVYVRLGNDFNGAVAAFAMYRIEMTELMGVPEDLRNVLETCLTEEASKETLDQFLPKVRSIITDLLQGLRQKQSMYRRIVSDGWHRSEGGDSRSSRSSKRATADSAMGNGEGSETSSRRSTPGSRRKELPPMQEEPPVVRSSTPVQAQPRSSTPVQVQPRSSTPVQARPQIASNHSFPSPRAIPSEITDAPSRARSTSAAIQGTNGFLDRDAPPRHQSLHASRHSEDITPTATPTPPQSLAQPQARPASGVPAHVKRYSLVDKPVTSPTPPPEVVIDEPNTPPVEQPSPSQTASPQTNGDVALPASDSQTLATEPGVQTSLTALRERTVLERRASKRFSSYNFAKMVGGGSLRERPSANGSSTPNRRSLAVSSALSPGDLAVLTEADDEGTNAMAASPARRARSRGTRQPPRNASPIAEEEEVPPPVPSLPPKEPPPPVQHVRQPSTAAATPEPQPAETTPMLLTVFLQVGREVKKATIEPSMTQSSLKLLFVDKFSYNPGQDNFPAIYIRDPSSGVQYELEDMDEIKDRCLLSLNIEPLDQIKQHIDVQIASLAQEMKDLRAAVSTNRRTSMPPPIFAQPLAESTPAPARPSDHQFRKVARRLSRLIPDDGPLFEEEPTPIAPQMTGAFIQPQMTGASVMSEYTNRVVVDLKTQFDEVQNLRRDLGIMRQLYTDFMKQTKESLGALRTQTQNVRQLASNKIGGARQYIDDGKAKLDSRSQNVLTKMEELQDTVESIKDDVIKRSISPKPFVLKNVKGDMDAVAAELQNLKEHIQTVKPMWKKTWEEELQNIVEEQQFLQHQEEFLSDLLEDHKAVVEVWGHVEKVITLRGSASARASRSTKGFKPPPLDEGHTGLSTVLLEIRGSAADSERRLKAIAATEKAREKELTGQGDEFQNELSGFVEGRKLKKTGGAEEVERVRQRRNEQTLKAMFTGSSVASSNGGGVASGPTSPMSP